MHTVSGTSTTRAAVRCERRADDTLLLRLVGHWRMSTTAPDVSEVYAQLDAKLSGDGGRAAVRRGPRRRGDPGSALADPEYRGAGTRHADVTPHCGDSAPLGSCTPGIEYFAARSLAPSLALISAMPSFNTASSSSA